MGDHFEVFLVGPGVGHHNPLLLGEFFVIDLDGLFGGGSVRASGPGDVFVLVGIGAMSLSLESDLVVVVDVGDEGQDLVDIVV